MARYLLLLLLFGVCVAPSTAQQGCADELRSVLEQARRSVEASPAKALTTRIEMTTVPTKEGSRATREEILLASGKGRSITDNAYFSIYADKEARVVVLPKDSIVYVYDQGKRTNEPDFQRWDENMDIIFKLGTPTVCRRATERGIERLEVTFQLPPDGKSWMMQQVTFVVDKTHGKPMRLEATYHKGYELRSQSMRYLSYEPGKLDPRLERRSTDLALNGRELRKPFTGFELRDMRERIIDHVHH